MWTVPKNVVENLLRLDLSARLREAKEKEVLYKYKWTHQQSFETFEQTVQQGEEDFEQWDDYVEWKAYRKVRRDLEQKIEALRRGDFEVA